MREVKQAEKTIIKPYINIKKEDFYHIETRCVSLAGVNINDNTHGHWSDNEIIQLLDNKGEVAAMAYINRNDMTCAEVIMVDLLFKNIEE